MISIQYNIPKIAHKKFLKFYLDICASSGITYSNNGDTVTINYPDKVIRIAFLKFLIGATGIDIRHKRLAPGDIE